MKQIFVVISMLACGFALFYRGQSPEPKRVASPIIKAFPPQALSPRHPDAAISVPALPQVRKRDLAATALNVNAPGDDRWAALDSIIRSGLAGKEALMKIATAPFPRVDQELEIQAEVTLRISTLEALDQLAAKGEDVKSVFEQGAFHPVHPTLQMMSIVALRGIEQGRPGKLTRFISEMTGTESLEN